MVASDRRIARSRAAATGVLSQYGDDGAPIVAALRGALVRRLDELELEPRDLGAYDDAIELADALRDLDALSPPLAARVEGELTHGDGRSPE